MEMNSRLATGLFAAAGLLAVLAAPETALATQGHGGREGLYVHQFSHIFFCISMGILIYWLKSRNLTREPGWRWVGISALLFILWSADAFTVHLLDEQLVLIDTSRVGAWRMHIDAADGYGWVRPIYYLAKLDHLFCVPALIFLYLGLRRLLMEAAAVRPAAPSKKEAP